MTPDQRFALLISGIGLLFTMLSALVVLIWKAGGRTGETVAEVKRIGTALDQHIQWHISNPGRR
jgi:Na+-transporting methylmalonyl-CoA/oxaloacetate decarboxylase gamma subunit